PRRQAPPPGAGDRVGGRRPSANDGVPPDDDPTDLLDLEDPEDDLLDEGVSDDPYGAYDDEDLDDLDDADDDRAVAEYLEDELGDDDTDDDADDDRRRGRPLVKWVAAVGVLVLLAGGAYFGAAELLGFGYEDYEGAGEADVVVRVEEGDVTSAIAAEMVELDVVASRRAFLAASEGDDRVLGVRPGFYHMKTKMSGEKALERLVGDSSRVGHLQVRAGTQLSDVVQPDDSVTPGVFTLLSEASCAELNGESTCVSPEKLSETADSVDLTELGVPAWAEHDAAQAERGRTLEGLVAPGVYDVKPGWNAEQLLSEVLTTSATRLEAAGMPSSAGSTPYSPYQLMVIASIVEKEAVRSDFENVASVIYNRLRIDMALQMDSTVNYLKKRPELTTEDEDRFEEGPYNTYSRPGLPPTPIASPSQEAIEAALDPADTEYLYFVKCETNGLSCFSEDIDEHNANVEDARQRGIF
ncbi:endolytic transglycosylase MltG, partial [Saccharomonospora iraqiensis]|uniref:endolytic transglycosylase MltG n=1 Tax=Saccharomonospora iraqiensis TaxID=52698 RepID=UPI002D218810